MKKHLFALTIAIALVATACGDDGGGGDTSAPTDPRGQQIVDLISDDPDFPLTESEANCTANNLLANLDDSTIDAMLADPENGMDDIGDPDETLAAFDSLLDCVDLETMMVDQMTADGSMTEDQAKCVAEGFGEDELREFIRTSALPDDQVDEAAALELIGRLMEIGSECGLS